MKKIFDLLIENRFARYFIEAICAFLIGVLIADSVVMGPEWARLYSLVIETIMTTALIYCVGKLEEDAIK